MVHDQWRQGQKDEAFKQWWLASGGGDITDVDTTHRGVCAGNFPIFAAPSSAHDEWRTSHTVGVDFASQLYGDGRS